MAIIYSYPQNQNILNTDTLVCTSTALINGKPKNQTKNISIADLATFIVTNSNIDLNTVLLSGNVSTLDASIGNLYLYDIPYGSYGFIKFDNANFSVTDPDGITSFNVELDGFSVKNSNYFSGYIDYTNLTSNRNYFLPNATGTFALTSDLTTNGTLFSAVSTTYQTAAGALQSISAAIPSSIFTNGNLLKLNAAITTTAASVAIVVIEFYINSAATISGATLIGRYNGPIGNLYIPIDRFFWVSGTTLYGRDFTASASTSTSNSAFAINSVAIPATQFYIITQVTTTSTDRAAISTIKIEKS